MRSQSSAPVFEWFFREPLASGHPLPTSCRSVARKSGRGPRDLGGEARRERELVRELAARELPQPIERGHRVNVDRVHVVDVVVHAPGHGQKLGHHREQEPHVVQLADDRPAAHARLGDGAHEVDEERRRLGARRGARSHQAGSAAARAIASRAKGRERRVLAARTPRRRAARRAGSLCELAACPRS